MSTIRDVARLAGVSVSTVSYALTGDRPISSATRERVLGAARSLGYQVNDVAKSLKTGRTMSLGLIIPDILNPFFTVIARAAEDAASAHGYSLILCNSCNDAARERRYLDLLRSRRVDGLIYMAGSSVPHALLRALIEQGFPLVIIDEELQGIDTTSVLARNYEGGLALGQYLAHLGHHHIGIISGPPELKTAQARLAGFIDGVVQYGVCIGRDMIVDGDYQIESGRAATTCLLGRSSALSAIFAANDLMAIGALQRTAELGLRAPRDLSIAGFDDIPLASMVTPALTTVEQPAQAMGEHAVTLLLALVQQGVASGRHIVLDTYLRIRASSGPPRSPAQQQLTEARA